MIVVAIPTIPVRGDAWKDVADVWYSVTPDEAIICVPSWRHGSWAAGLNEVWEQHPKPDIFICGSDDMTPEEGWLEAVLPYVEDACIAPQVLDPRFARWEKGQVEGEETRMSTFPIIAGKYLKHVFPLPPELHYYSDDLISDRLRAAGIPTVAVPSCVITHQMDMRGRGAGMGDESLRMAHDKAIYKRVSV